MGGVDGLSIIESGPRRPKVKMKAIPTEYSAEFISESIIHQNSNMESVSMTDINPLFKCGKRNSETVDWVIELSPTAYKTLLNKRTFVGMVSVFPRAYISAPYCRRCLSLEHKTSECNKDIRCYHCSILGHDSKSCPTKEKPPTCAHCGKDHKTMAKLCSVWMNKIMAIERITSYD